MKSSFIHPALGADTSNLTGQPWLVQDFARLAISVETSAATASLITVVGTNDDGLQSALRTPSQTVGANGWNIVTTLSAKGLYEFDPGALGFRWINVFRNAFDATANSVVTVAMTGSW